ncbi:MAG: hypothetical protein LJE70_18225, partial [Chromatiaceae bacterium]|nr:hypothetical protein [Chromatiaceae bacterium]
GDGRAGGTVAKITVSPSPHPSPPRGEGEQEALRAPIGSETGWHCNLLRIERRKCVLFTHDETLFSFLLCGLTHQVAEAAGQRRSRGA